MTFQDKIRKFCLKFTEEISEETGEYIIIIKITKMRILV